MRYLRQAVIIFGATMVGEILKGLLPFPVPAGVYGLFFLLLCLVTGLVKLEHVEETGNLLLDLMPLMFVPVSVGLLESFEEARQIFIPLLVITALSTVIVMAVTGKAAEWIIKITKKGER